MAELGISFDNREVEPTSEYAPLPRGEYIAMITASDVKETKAETGKYLKLVFQILEGKFQNRILFHNLNIVNPNSEAQAIGRGQLSAISRACGINGELKDSNELHDCPIRIVVDLDKQNPEQNKIKAFKPYAIANAQKVEDAENPEQNVAAQIKEMPPETQKAKAPWAK